MGTFIVIEGPDGSGKSTQLQLLAQNMQTSGFAVVTTREPGGTALGERIRQLLLERSFLPEPSTELLLFAAARAELVAKVIAPALAASQNVVCDRFAASTVAYQGYGLGINLDIIASVNKLATGGLEPDVYFLLDIPPDIGLRRKRGSVNRIDERELDFHSRVRNGYLEMARSRPDLWVVLDGSKPPEELASQIWDRVKTILSGG